METAHALETQMICNGFSASVIISNNLGSGLVACNTGPPSVVASVSPTELWPPNHKMVPVSVEVTRTTDSCDSSSALTCSVVGVSSNEPLNGIDDGNTDVAYEITGPLNVDLRAERSGSGNGRIYTITTECVDAFGNTGIGTTEVNVPHSKIDGFVSGDIQAGVSIGLYKVVCGDYLLFSTAITGSDGYYLFDLQPENGSYTVFPEEDAYIFGPVQVGIQIPQKTEFGTYDFTATAD
jgi:hypothetical protein